MIRTAALLMLLTLPVSPLLATATAPTTTSLEAEVMPPASLPCFPGAYYRKAVSSFNHWTGIEGVVRLPHPTLDPTRRRPNNRLADNPSIYLGGRAKNTEIDAGLSWEVIKEADGTVSKDGKAFRPFWRNKVWGTGPARPEYYFYPGDLVRMKCETTTQPGELRLEICLVARAPGSTAPVSAVPLRQTFAAPDFGTSAPQQFKRVNAIDQAGNEGKPVVPTKSVVADAEWESVYLLQGTERLPMVPGRYTDMRCPDPKHFQVSPSPQADQGGEIITIRGASDAP